MAQNGNGANRGDLLRDTAQLLQAFDRAGRNAMWRHKRMGVPVVLWRDGAIVEVPAEEIPEEWCEEPERLAFPW